MVAPLSASLTAPLTGTATQGADPQEAARIKAEILSARNELQCATCEGDKATLKDQISTLETRLRQVETTSRAAPAQAASESSDTLRAGEDGGRSGLSAGLVEDRPSVVIDPQTAEKAREAGRDGDGGIASLATAASAQERGDVSPASSTFDVRQTNAGAFSYGANGRADLAVTGPVAPGSQLDISV
ncbi:hypothetical protein [Breoghania sp.]|uniref:hypothetical protein n=1 Tax=Breoghania sp. TaxID=2065378 RepID=UPI002AA645F7|nr:hypothetical protein [Breoghania sp.]